MSVAKNIFKGAILFDPIRVSAGVASACYMIRKTRPIGLSETAVHCLYITTLFAPASVG